MVLRMFYFYDMAREMCFPIEADTDTAVLLNYFAFQSLRLYFSDFNLCAYFLRFQSLRLFSQISIFAPMSLANSFTIAVSPGHAGAVTRLPSTTAWSTGTGVQTNIFRSTAAGDEESLIIFSLDRVKISSQSKVVSPQLSIGLLTEEIVDSSCHSFSCLLVGADCIDLISQDAESLEGHHGLIIFCEITA